MILTEVVMNVVILQDSLYYNQK